MSRGITTYAQEYDVTENMVECIDDPDVSELMCVPKVRAPRTDDTKVQMKTNKQTTRRVMSDPRAKVSESFTQDIYEEESKQRKLMERVRELASMSK